MTQERDAAATHCAEHFADMVTANQELEEMTGQRDELFGLLSERRRMATVRAMEFDKVKADLKAEHRAEIEKLQAKLDEYEDNDPNLCGSNAD